VPNDIGSLTEARDILRGAGAEVDTTTLSVRFDAAPIEEAIAAAPSLVKLPARNPAHNIEMGEDRICFAAVGGPPHCTDLERGRRAGTLADFDDFMRLTQAFDVVHMNGMPVEPIDIPTNVRHLNTAYATLTLTDKVPFVYSRGKQAVADVLEMVRIVRQVSPEQFAREPSVYTVVNANSPLQYDVPMAQGPGAKQVLSTPPDARTICTNKRLSTTCRRRSIEGSPSSCKHSGNSAKPRAEQMSADGTGIKITRSSPLHAVPAADEITTMHRSGDESDERGTQRRHLYFNLAVYDDDSGEMIGRLGDLTHEGLMVISPAPLAIDRVYNLRVELPEALDDAVALEFVARSCYCHPDVNAEYYDTGFQIADPSTAHIDTVREWVSRYGFHA